MTLKRQEYICEECGVESHIYHDVREDFMSVLRKIEDDHRHWSPECNDMPIIRICIGDD